MTILNFCKAIALTAVTAIALTHGPAKAGTVDFTDHANPVVPVDGGIINYGGFTFFAPFIGVVNGTDPNWDYGVGNGGPMLVFYGGGSDTNFLTVSQTNGGPFSLSALQVGRWFGLDTEGPNVSLSITGFSGPGQTGGQVILPAFALPQNTIDLTPIAIQPLSFQSLTFRLSGDTNGGGYVALDNLVLTPVPEPETYALLLAGLGLLAVVGRRRKTLG
jgi:hypothetical protein